MSNVKTSDESPAATLSGTEMIRMVQGGVNVRGTPSQIKDYVGAGLIQPSLFRYVLSVSGGVTSALNTATGIVDYSGSDAGPVLRSVMSAIAATGGQVLCKAGIYTIDSFAHETGTGWNGNTYALYYGVGFPNQPASDQRTSYAIIGESVTGAAGESSSAIQTNGVIFKITSTAIATVTSSDQVVGIWSVAPGGAAVHGSEITIKNVCVRFPDNQRGNTHGVNLSECCAHVLDRVQCDFDTQYSTFAAPVNGTAGSYGIVTMNSGHANWAIVDNCWVAGYYTGYWFNTEHVISTAASAIWCNTSMQIGAASGWPSIYHPITIIKFTDQECINGPVIKNTVQAGAIIRFINFDLEVKTSGTFARVNNAIEDTPGRTYGEVTYVRVIAGTGISSGAFWNSGSGLNYSVWQGGDAGPTYPTIAIKGSTSGVISIKPQAAAGTYNFNLPNTAGTTGQALVSQGGGVTAMAWTTGTLVDNVWTIGGTVSNAKTLKLMSYDNSVGVVFARMDSGGAMKFGDVDNAGSMGPLTIWLRGSQFFTMSTVGNIQFNHYGAGTLSTDASGNITATSDERLKHVEGHYVRGLDAVVKIDPIVYRWNENSGFEQDTSYAGFSAQNVQAAIPEAVGSNSDGMLTLSDRPLTAALINAVKELSARVIALEMAAAAR